jgi:hypothetical protein
VSEQLGAPPPGEDEMDRMLRELTEEISSAGRIREPSAAERAKAAKKRPVRRGRDGLRRGGRVAGWSAAVVVLAAAGFFGWHQLTRSGVGGPNDTQVVTNGAVPSSASPTAASPTAAVSPGAQPLTGSPADPFAGTAAAQWADGAAGITLPAAVSHGPFTASQVAGAYATTRKLLIAQNLDQSTLRGGAPTAFAGLLTPQQRSQFTAGLDKIGLSKQGYALSTRDWVASFAPGTTTLIGSVIKVHGTMSARSATDQGQTVLEINVNYRFVYAVEPPHDPADWMRIVGQVTGYVEFDNWQDPGGPIQPWVISALPSEAGARCGTTDGYSHSDYQGGPASKVQPSGAPINPYSMSNASTTGICQNTTGT